jgi:uncharacterized integral membrane protein (TIGR00697 family)
VDREIFMMSEIITSIQTSALGSEYISLVMVIACSILIILSQRLSGLVGLYAYNIVAIVASNIQVLQVSHFVCAVEPFALGTITFATTFLVSDIISENYGKEAAQRGVLLSFIAQGSFTSMMLISALYKPAQGFENISDAVALLFTPSWRIYIASIFSFSASQYFDIVIFKTLKDATGDKMLWFRTLAATGISGFIDNFIFSYLAWVVLSPEPITMKSLFLTYILAAYIGRLVVNIITIPVMYLAKALK